jgi:hypothetical protein
MIMVSQKVYDRFWLSVDLNNILWLTSTKRKKSTLIIQP